VIYNCSIQVPLSSAQQDVDSDTDLACEKGELVESDSDGEGERNYLASLMTEEDEPHYVNEVQLSGWYRPDDDRLACSEYGDEDSVVFSDDEQRSLSSNEENEEEGNVDCSVGVPSKDSTGKYFKEQSKKYDWQVIDTDSASQSEDDQSGDDED